MRSVYTVRQKGFTLVELVMVIIILSALGVMTSSYIGTGVDIYSDVAERDRSLNSIRFVMERLRREVANALPNSATVSADGLCLTFTPIIASSLYSDSDFPISPLTDNTGKIAAISDYDWVSGDKAAVYLLADDELTTSDKVQTITAVNGDKDLLTFSGSISFPLGSPAKRLYIIRDNISYYFSSTNIYRSSQCDSGVLMAENITGSFSAAAATLQRNALVQVEYKLYFDGQEVPVVQSLHISNVP